MTHKETAYAQMILTVLYFGGYFWLLYDFIHGRINVANEWKDTLQNLLSVLTGGVVLITAFWFNRQRESKDANAPNT